MAVPYPGYGKGENKRDGRFPSEVSPGLTLNCPATIGCPPEVTTVQFFKIMFTCFSRRMHLSLMWYRFFRFRPEGSRTPFVNEGFSDDLCGSEKSHKSRGLSGASSVFMSTWRPDGPTTPIRSERSLRPVPSLPDHHVAKSPKGEPYPGEANIRFDHSRHQQTRPDFTRGATTARPRTPVEDYEERPSSSSSLIRGKSPVRRKLPVPEPEPYPDYDL
ncbi:uncharacterized protein LOC124137704 [Haliotis rufescens]|uniref:uncharacterized protein LOC124137704 n=1 Tax=Haliotis rufescens TaxID=6454 RepID=UPI00201FB0BB|nr:uncharacterized protein LOC124137704 [Haliotis rufescens]